MQGFIVSEHMELWPQALKELGMQVATGGIKYRETDCQWHRERAAGFPRNAARRELRQAAGETGLKRDVAAATAGPAGEAVDGSGRRRQPMSELKTVEFRALNHERQVRLQGMPLASFGARAGAFLIDGVIVGLLLLVPSLWSSLEMQANAAPLTLTLDFGALVSVVIGVLYFGLAAFLGNGATPRQAGTRHTRRVAGPRTDLAVALDRACARLRGLIARGRIRLPAVLHPSQPADSARPDRRNDCDRRDSCRGAGASSAWMIDHGDDAPV